MDMAMGTERSKPLHNFTLPCDLRWGNQRFLRCMKVNSGGQISPHHRIDANSSGSSDHHHHHPIQQRRTTRDRDRERDKDSSPEFAHGSPKVGRTPPPARRFGDDDGGDGIAAIREKVMLDLQTAADKMKDAFFKDGLEEGEVSISRPLLPPPPPPPEAASAEGEASRPWNLRTRRAACKIPIPETGFVFGKNGGATAAGNGNNRVDALKPNSGLPQIRATAVQKSPIHRNDGGVTAAIGEKQERAKFSVSLSKREIEEDFFAIVGHRPPRRPKKRARIVQKQLDVNPIPRIVAYRVKSEGWTNVVANFISIANLEFKQSVEIPLVNCGVEEKA
ncbi:hypothetical protein DH2020_020726 [Rehmannia glutinosa]|uniref:Uncharacterized protein n=1 Tax=Rehmannia glutinosa TaxID=99300 RepID=A0ABR0WHF9_REHGL